MTDKFKGDIFKTLLTLSIPILGTSFIQMAYSLVDMMWIGKVGSAAVAAVGTASFFTWFGNSLVMITKTGAQVGVSQAIGKKDENKKDIYIHTSIFMCSIIAVAYTAFLLIFKDALIGFFKLGDKEIISMATRYLVIVSLGMICAFLNPQFTGIITASGNSKLPFKVNTIGLIINIVLDPVMIFGIGPFKAMGVKGAALATLVARILELGCSIVISYKDGYIHPDMKRLFYRNKQLAKDFQKCALPLLGACLFWGIGFTSYSSFMGHLGVNAAAANSVAAVVRDIICCFSAGISSAAGIMVGNELGAGNLRRGKLYGIRLLKISLVCGVMASLLMLVTAPIILHFVNLTPQAAGYLKGMFGVIAFYMIGRSVNDVTINGIFGAGGDTMFDMYSLAVCMWCLAIPLAALGTYYFHWPVVIVYACTCIDEVGKLPWVFLHFRKYKWVKDLTH